MRLITRRVHRLENTRALAAAVQVPFRVVVSFSGKRLNLETSTVQRIVNGNGTFTEFVTLDGSRADITDDELDQFVAEFGLTPPSGRRANSFR